MTKKCFRKIYSVMPEPVERLCMKYENGIIYIFYGVITTVINYLAHFGIRIAATDFSGMEDMTLSALLRQMEEHSAVASSAAATFAWVVAVIFAFFVNKFIVFESSSTNARSVAEEFFSFAGGRLFSYGCEFVIMLVFVDILRLNELIVKLVCNVIVMILNYLISKFIVFSKKKTG